MKHALSASALCASVWIALARADAAPELLADDLITDIGVARIADEAGDTTLLRALHGELGRQASLTALRAAPHAYAHEQLWPALAVLSCGRDPILAPEAASALVQLESRVSASEFAAREVLVADLKSARAALVCPKDSAPPRIDIALSLARFGARVDQLLAAFAAP